MTLKKRLEQAGVKVLAGHYDSSAWSIIMVDEDVLIEVAKKVGMAFHEDRSPIHYAKKGDVDREVYVVPFNGVVVRCIVEGE